MYLSFVCGKTDDKLRMTSAQMERLWPLVKRKIYKFRELQTIHRLCQWSNTTCATSGARVVNLAGVPEPTIVFGFTGICRVRVTLALVFSVVFAYNVCFSFLFC